MPDKLLTVEQLSDALGGISRATIYRHVRTLPGFPPIVKIGAATRFRESDVQAFIHDHADKAKEPKIEEAR